MSRFLILLCAFFSFQSMLEAFEMSPDLYSDHLKKGENLLINIEKKAEVYGACWVEALVHLNRECAYLSATVQSRLAIDFANCFLKDVGKPICPCGLGTPVASCLENCNDQTFSVYTEFFIYTHSICFFIKHKSFESEMAKNALNLHLITQILNTQLKNIVENNAEHQNKLMKLLNKSLTDVQLLDAEIIRSREQANELFANFQKATLNNTYLILKLFEKINNIKNFFLTEIQFFYTVFFYTGIIIFFYFITTNKKIKKSRLIISLNILMFGFLEYQLNSIFISYDFSVESRISFCWYLREISIALCILIIIRSYISYVNYPKESFDILIKMSKDMGRVLALLENSNSETLRGNQGHCTLGCVEQLIKQGQLVMHRPNEFTIAKDSHFNLGTSHKESVKNQAESRWGDNMMINANRGWNDARDETYPGPSNSWLSSIGFSDSLSTKRPTGEINPASSHSTVATHIRNAKETYPFLNKDSYNSHLNLGTADKESGKHQAESRWGDNTMINANRGWSYAQDEAFPGPSNSWSSSIGFSDSLSIKNIYSHLETENTPSIDSHISMLARFNNKHAELSNSSSSENSYTMQDNFNEKMWPYNSPVSYRADGSVRKMVKVKEGYVPPNYIPDAELVHVYPPLSDSSRKQKHEKKLSEIKELIVKRNNGEHLSNEQKLKIQHFEASQNLLSGLKKLL